MLASVREKFLNFFKSKNHLIIESASLLPKNDPTLLFVNSGMAPLKKFFLQEETPPASALTDSQRCLRVGGKHNDLSEVGYTKRHHTFFEMLGNFSFGAYFKEQAIPYAWEFLTQVLRLDPERLSVTIHPLDKDARRIWEKTAPELAGRIVELQENEWSMGPIGPCGFCTEIFYDLRIGEGDLAHGDRFLEIWNLVFMQWFDNGKTRSELPLACIDTGMGLERITAVLEGVSDTYDISFFKNSIKFLNLSKHTPHSKIFLDHLRSISFLIMEGIRPGPGKREYVLRRLMRRALKSFFEFGDLDFSKTLNLILNQWKSVYETLDIPLIISIFTAEKNQFASILEKGNLLLEEMYRSSNHFSADQIFLLHDTFGFSVDIVQDLVKMRGGSIDLQGFEHLMDLHKENSRKDQLNTMLPYPKTRFCDVFELQANILAVEGDSLILDQTPFYAESGGQIGDIGFISSENFEVQITDTQKVGNVVLHRFEVLRGTPDIGKILAKIDTQYRNEIRAHHSATHLLHAALCEILGSHIKQMGSLVDSSHLRFDFSHPETLSHEQIAEIEKLVNLWIRENHKVVIQEMNLDEAVNLGAKAFFDSYENLVRTIKMGNRSFELCGGSHVSATGDIGFFKITKWSAISGGVKRIEACVGQSAFDFVQQNFELTREISSKLKVPFGYILKRIDELLLRKVEEKLLLNKIELKNGRLSETISLGYGFASDTCISDIEKYMKAENLNAACIIVKDEKKTKIFLKLCNLDLDAKEILQSLGSNFGAKGVGGRKDFAQTGGPTLESDHKIFEQLFVLLQK